MEEILAERVWKLGPKVFSKKFPEIERILEKTKREDVRASFKLCLEKTVWFYFQN